MEGWMIEIVPEFSPTAAVFDVTHAFIARFSTMLAIHIQILRYSARCGCRAGYRRYALATYSNTEVLAINQDPVQPGAKGGSTFKVGKRLVGAVSGSTLRPG